MEKDLIKKPSNKEHVFLGCIIVLAGALLLANLGNHYLWQDEAQTALIAKTVMARGLPYGTDGTNYFSQENGAEYGPNYIWKWHTWLPFYILAGVFKIFGISTFTARLPFALFGIGTFPLLYFYTADLFKNKRIAVFTTLLLISCIPFLILSRQCRYYSMTAFFSVLSLYAYHHILRNGNVPFYYLSSQQRCCSKPIIFISPLSLQPSESIVFCFIETNGATSDWPVPDQLRCLSPGSCGCQLQNSVNVTDSIISTLSDQLQLLSFILPKPINIFFRHICFLFPF
ncbi:MAG: glycosyltransferase family 39 protein [Phycisphaerae bacterium]|nr:glycosyltransferase family 39 protein [Phycisphaerae bacterium]